MNTTIQLVIVFLLIISAIIYFVDKCSNNKNNHECDKKCSQCDLYKHCKSKK